jgi:hypothetical protein
VTTFALCQHPAATVPIAPATHTTRTSSATLGRADSATTPPAASITAAASWVGATARNTCCTKSSEGLRTNDHTPSAAVTTAAHRLNRAGTSMGFRIRSVG